MLLGYKVRHATSEDLRMRAQSTAHIEFALDGVLERNLLCAPTRLDRFLAANNTRDNLPATSTGSQVRKDKFAPARRERAAHKCRNIFVANMTGFFLTSALLRHACAPIWPTDLMVPGQRLSDKAAKISYRAMLPSESRYSQASCDQICRSQESFPASRPLHCHPMAEAPSGNQESKFRSGDSP